MIMEQEGQMKMSQMIMILGSSTYFVHAAAKLCPVDGPAPFTRRGG